MLYYIRVMFFLSFYMCGMCGTEEDILVKATGRNFILPKLMGKRVLSEVVCLQVCMFSIMRETESRANSDHNLNNHSYLKKKLAKNPSPTRVASPKSMFLVNF